MYANTISPWNYLLKCALTAFSLWVSRRQQSTNERLEAVGAKLESFSFN